VQSRYQCARERNIRRHDETQRTGLLSVDGDDKRSEVAHVHIHGKQQHIFVRLHKEIEAAVEVN
jgi:hypothetical protein